MTDFIQGDWGYDIETYPNIFTCTVASADKKKIKTFEVSSRKNETKGLLTCFRWLREKNQRMVGFNNVGFDYPVIHFILLQAIEAKRKGYTYWIDYKQVYEKAQEVIKSKDYHEFGITIPEKEVLIKQVDLYKIHHFDNKARATSLKMLQFNMRSESIEDLPFPVGTVLTESEMDELVKYNQHDVIKTLDFYSLSLDAIRFRAELTKALGFDVTNFNDTKIGKEYFINRLEKALPGSCYKKTPHGRKLNQSKRPYTDIKDCLFTYYDFKRPEFKTILEWFGKQRITETRGSFSDIEEHDLGDLAQYMELKVKRKKFTITPTQEEMDDFQKEHPNGWISVHALKSPRGAYSHWMNWRVAESIHVIADGFRFDFGTGGIHGSLTSSVVKSSDTHMIIDADVASMYPNIAIANRSYPEHLSERFCDIYKDVYEKRKGYAKGTPENAVMKLALNGVYGDSNNQYSPFYDPKYTMTITINGQLSLLLLTERLMDIEGLSLVQVNTDGITVVCPRDSKDRYDQICNQWQKDVGLELEYVEYSAMFIRDVNNYIAVKTKGGVKRKGAYEYEDLGWHQDHSALVIPKAAESAMVYGKDIEQFIRNHGDKFDFMLRTKVDRKSSLVLVTEDGTEIQQQNICRYYPSKNGGKLVKIMPPLEGKEEYRRIGIDKDWNIKTCNNMVDFDGDVDYDYYIEQAKKLMMVVDTPN